LAFRIAFYHFLQIILSFDTVVELQLDWEGCLKPLSERLVCSHSPAMFGSILATFVEEFIANPGALVFQCGQSLNSTSFKLAN
jgi:hypothetical protein